MRLTFIVLAALLLPLWPQDFAATAVALRSAPTLKGGVSQTKARRTRRKKTQPRRDTLLSPVVASKPNPLTLVVSITEERKVLLNHEDEGMLEDLSRLRSRLEGIFEKRKEERAYKPGTIELEKTVIVKASPFLSEEELATLVREVKASGASPVNVLSEEEFNKILAAEVPRPVEPATLPTSRKIIQGAVLNGNAISLPKPDYPPIAKAARASGMVAVEVVVDESGNVASARAVSGHALLRSAAVEAARQAKFPPTVLAGQPVKVKGIITYTFVL